MSKIVGCFCCAKSIILIFRSISGVWFYIRKIIKRLQSGAVKISQGQVIEYG